MKKLKVVSTRKPKRLSPCQTEVNFIRALPARGIRRRIRKLAKKAWIQRRQEGFHVPISR